MDVGELNGRRLYTGLRLDYKLRLSAPISASRAVSAVVELLVQFSLSSVLLNVF